MMDEETAGMSEATELGMIVAAIPRSQGGLRASVARRLDAFFSSLLLLLDDDDDDDEEGSSASSSVQLFSLLRDYVEPFFMHPAIGGMDLTGVDAEIPASLRPPVESFLPMHRRGLPYWIDAQLEDRASDPAIRAQLRNLYILFLEIHFEMTRDLGQTAAGMLAQVLEGYKTKGPYFADAMDQVASEHDFHLHIKERLPLLEAAHNHGDCQQPLESGQMSDMDRLFAIGAEVKPVFDQFVADLAMALIDGDAADGAEAEGAQDGAGAGAGPNYNASNSDASNSDAFVAGASGGGGPKVDDKNEASEEGELEDQIAKRLRRSARGHNSRTGNAGVQHEEGQDDDADADAGWETVSGSDEPSCQSSEGEDGEDGDRPDASGSMTAFMADVGGELVQRFGVTLVKLKGDARTLQNFYTNEAVYTDGDCRKILDVVRGRLVCNRAADIAAAVHTIASNPAVQVVSICNHLLAAFEAQDGRWADVLVYFYFKDGPGARFICELQVAHSSFVRIRELVNDDEDQKCTTFAESLLADFIALDAADLADDA